MNNKRFRILESIRLHKSTIILTSLLLLNSSTTLGSAAPNGVIAVADNCAFSDDISMNHWHNISNDGKCTDLGTPVAGPVDNFAITYGDNYNINASFVLIDGLYS